MLSPNSTTKSLAQNARAIFREHFGNEATHVAVAPGRVNLIGEHIDYHGYSVLPMALGTQDVVIAGGAAAGGGFHVGNVNPKWERATLPLDPTAPVGAETGVKWYKYVHCGYKGAFDFAKDKGLFTLGSEPKGINLMVDGAVPPGSWTSLYFDLLLLLVFEHCYPPPFPSLLTHSHTHTHCHVLIYVFAQGLACPPPLPLWWPPCLPLPRPMALRRK
jgi:galactokinase